MLNANTKVFITIFPPGAPQQWLVNSQTIRDKNTGTLILWPTWDTDPSRARSMTFEYASAFRERYLREQGHQSHFALQAGDKSFVEEPSASAGLSGEDQRSPEAYQGYLVRPGVDVRTGQRCFYIKLRDPRQGELPSIRADTPAEAVQKLIEQGKQNFAEKELVQPAPQQPVVAAPAASYRLRPGSFR